MSDIWSKLQYFRKNSVFDDWGNADLISSELLLKLDRFRNLCGSPVIVTCGTGGAHVEDSFHYSGLAVDVIIHPRPHIIHPVDGIFKAFKCGFTGIGYYPDWKYKGMICGGYHLDIGLPNKELKRTWMGILKPSEDGMKMERDYIALNKENLAKYISF